MVSRALMRAARAESGQGLYVPGAMPAPVLGWNARDSLDGMAPGYAVKLDNFFPYNGFVSVRAGSSLLVDGLGGRVETLAYWSDAITEKIVAGANGQLWEVSAGAKTSLGSGFTLNSWQWVQNKGTRTAAGDPTAILYLLNGADTPQAYDGATIAPVTWAAAPSQPTLDLTKLINAAISKDVLFVAERGQLGFWHSAKGQVSPAVTLSWFDLGTILPNGGEIVSIATYTVDGGAGPDDYTCFVANTGWIAVYRGGDPSDAQAWAILGRYNLGFVLGYRSTLEIAGDVIVMTVNGYISMRQFVQIGGLLRQSFVFNDNIQPEVVRQTNDYKFAAGWQPVLMPGLTLGLFNVPQGGNRYDQHVVNTQTGAWSRIVGYNGISWLATTQELLYGTEDGKVATANSGDTELDQSFVEADGITAFTYAGQRGVRKLWQMYRPILETAGEVSARMSVAVDFDLGSQLFSGEAAPNLQIAQWDSSEWNTSFWGGASQTKNEWLSIGQLGYSAAFRLNVRTTGSLCRWKGTDYSYSPGGLL